jgi:protein involved in polysaccharide export with SLBB domain
MYYICSFQNASATTNVNKMTVKKGCFGFRSIAPFIIFIILTGFINSHSFGQDQTQLPETQLDPALLKQANQSNLQQLLKDKNQANTGQDNHNNRIKNTKKTKGDSIIKQETNGANMAEEVYGSSLFKNSTVMQLSELSTPPLDYPIGVGDHIVVSLWGGADFENDYLVARDGSIFPQSIGKITVQGLSFENARRLIIDRFRKAVPASTNITVTMGQPRSIIVNVSGEVNSPGPVVVSAFTNALNVIAMAGGLNEYGNMRNIIIKRNNTLIDSLDVYRYLTSGDFGKHLYLENNDFVIVSFYDKKVFASGQFKRPMYYQLKKNEGLKELLIYAGGLTSNAFASSGAIIRNVNEKQQIKNINIKDNKANEELLDGDMIVINPINKGLQNKVIIKGEVSYPNTYELRKGDKLFDIINRAGGLTPNANLDRAFIYKKAGDSTILRNDKITVNLKDLNTNNQSINNIQLEPNDVVEIFNVNQFTEKQTVTIEGEVRSPKTVQRYGGLTLRDLIYMANGFKPSAEFGRIEVSSIVDIDSAQKGLKPTKTIVRTYNIKENLELDAETERVLLKPYDQVFVRKNPVFELQQNVSLQGELKYPGTYPKLDKNEHLSDFIERAGGFKETADVGGAILYRQKNTGQKANPYAKQPSTKYIKDSTGVIVDSVVFSPEEPISIDLYKAMKNKGSKYDLVLQEDDLLFVPEINPVVSVKGAVQSPLKIYFDKEHTNLNYYIDKAGGFGVKPWRKRIYVTYADGRGRRTKNFGFFHFYPRVEEGSIIVVPSRPEGKAAGELIQQILVTTIPVVLIYILTR